MAVVSGRPAEAVRARLPVPGIEVFGLYGLEGTSAAQPSPASSVRDDLARLAALVPGAWVEDKGSSLALHYREAVHPDQAEGELGPRVASLAERHQMTLLSGKRVFELAPAQTPGKGAVVTEAVRERGLRAVLYAGDDVADLDAFEALDRLRNEGLTTVKVVVRSAGTPPALRAAADVQVEDPSELVRLLETLASELPR